MNYFYSQKEKSTPYLAIPLFLLDERHKRLTSEAKLLYGLLLRRVNLSRKSGWLDERGRVFQHYPITGVMKSLDCCKQKAADTLRELEDAGLLERERQGLGKPAKLFLKTPAVCKSDSDWSMYEEILNRDIAL